MRYSAAHRHVRWTAGAMSLGLVLAPLTGVADLAPRAAAEAVATPIANLVVNDSGDDGDMDPDDGWCDTDTAAPGVSCTLRAALEVVQHHLETSPGAISAISLEVPSVVLEDPLTVVGSGARITVAGQATRHGAGATSTIFGPSQGPVLLVQMDDSAGQQSSLTLEGLRVVGRQADAPSGGGCLVTEGVELLGLERTEFVGCHSSSDGAAVSFEGGSSLGIDRSIFRGNEAVGSGGAVRAVVSQDMFGNGGSVSVETSLFDGNVSGGNGGSLAMFPEDFGPDVTIDLEAVRVTGSSAAGSGGGLFAGEYTSLQVNNSTVDGNRAEGTLAGATPGGQGGGIAALGDGFFYATTVSRNLAAAGGGLALNGTRVQGVAMTVADNVATESAGGIAFAGEVMLMAQSIVARNGAPEGDGADCTGTLTTGFDASWWEGQAPWDAEDITNLVGAAEPGACTLEGSWLFGNPGLSALGDFGGPAHLPVQVVQDRTAPAAGAIPPMFGTEIAWACPDERLFAGAISSATGSCDLGATNGLYASAVHLDPDDLPPTPNPAPARVSLDELATYVTGEAAAESADDPQAVGAPRSLAAIASLPLASLDLASTALGALPVREVLDLTGMVAPDAAGGDAPAIVLAALDQILLTNIQSEAGIAAILEGTALALLPPQTITLLDVLTLPNASAATTLIDSKLASVDLGGTPLASLPLASLPLASLPLASLPLASLGFGDGTGDTSLAGWCEFLASVGFDCGQFGIDPADADSATNVTLGSLALAGVPLASLPLASLPLASLPLASLPLASLPLGSTPLASLDISVSRMGDIPLASLPLASLGPQGAPLASLPLASLPLASLPLASLPLASLPLASLPLASLPLASLPLASLPLASLPLASLPLASLGRIVDCSHPDVDCAADRLGDVLAHILGSATLGDLIASSSLADYTLGDLAVDADNDGVIDSPSGLEGWRLADLLPSQDAADVAALRELLDTPGGNWLDITTMGDLEGAGTWDDVTLEDLLWPEDAVNQGIVGKTTIGEVAANVGDGWAEQLTLLDLLIGLLLTGDFEWPEVDLDTLPLWAFGRQYDDKPLSDDQRFAFGYAGGDLSPTRWVPVTVDVLVPQGVTDVPAITVSRAGGSNSLMADDLTLVSATSLAVYEAMLAAARAANRPTDGLPNLDGALVGTLVEPGHFQWTLDVRQYADLDFSVTVGGGRVAGLTEFDLYLTTPDLERPLHVPYEIEFQEPGDGNDLGGQDPSPVDLGTADEAARELFFTTIGQPGDVDVFAVTVVEDDERIGARLTGLAADLDLAVFGPTGVAGVPTGTRLSAVSTGGATTSPGDADAATQKSGAEIPDLDLPVVSVSTHAGTQDEQLTTGPLRAGTYHIAVWGHNGASSPVAAALQVQSGARIGILPECQTTPLFPVGTPGTPGTPTQANATPGGSWTNEEVNTIFLTNRERMEQLHGAAAATDVWNAVADVANGAMVGDADGLHGGVKGVLLPVETNARVAAAYLAWDGARCDVGAANEVATAIAEEVLDPARATYPNARFVTMVGADDVLPMYRVPDRATISNEWEYALSVLGQNNELVAALGGGNVLSDDPYADPEPMTIDDRPMFLPQVALGRVVERPEQIVAALNDFIAADGVLDAESATSINDPLTDPTGGTLDPITDPLLDSGTGTSRAVVAGYDFIADGAEAIAAELDPNYTVTRTINDSWDRQELLDRLTDADASTTEVERPEVISLNAHFDHSRLLPAKGNANAADPVHFEETDLFTTADAGDLFANRLLFSVGCHSALNTVDTQIGLDGQGNPIEDVDWAELIVSQGGVLIGNTGFGYGDDVIVDYSERLMQLFSAHVGDITVGQALAQAKADYASFYPAEQLDAYRTKASMEATLYGLPMYRLPSAAGPDATPVPTVGTTTPDGTGTVRSASFDVSAGAGTPVSAGELGTYYTVGGDMLAVPNKPIQPRIVLDVTSTDPALTPRGVVITRLQTTDVAGVDPVIARPTIDLAMHEPEPDVAVDAYPVVPGGISHTDGPLGARDTLVFVPGQFFGDPDGLGTGTQRLFTDAEATVMYGPASSLDTTAPQVPVANALVADGEVGFLVAATDDTDLSAVSVLYTTPGAGGQWTHLALEPVFNPEAVGGAASLWGGEAAVTGDEVTFVVQAVDTSGNVGHATSRGHGLASLTPLELVVDGADRDNDGTYEDDVRVTVANTDAPDLHYRVTTTSRDPNGQDVTTVGLDKVYDRRLGIRVRDFGHHVVTVWTRDGRSESVEFDSAATPTDVTPPTITIITPQAGLLLDASDTPPNAEYACADTETTVVACDGRVDNADGSQPVANGAPLPVAPVGPALFTVDAQDEVGNTASLTNPYRVVAMSDGGFTAVNTAWHLTIEGLQGAKTVGVAWGDGTTTTYDASGATFGSTGVLEASHAYTKPNLYTLTVTIDGASLPYKWAIIYDPNGNFITGGGEIEVEPGSVAMQPGAAGEASFGFVSQYVKSKSAPQGNSEFEFEVGNFHFKSTAYEWLVVADERGQYRGSGRVNGLPGYRFMVTGIDGDYAGGVGPDQFRLRVWIDAVIGQIVVFDSSMGTATDADLPPASSISEGSIVVHERGNSQSGVLP